MLRYVCAVLAVPGLLAACSTFPDAHSSIDSSTGFLAGSGDCGCIIHRRSDPSLQIDCGASTEMFATLGTAGVTYVGHVEFQYESNFEIYFGGGNGIFTLGDAYDDPRGSPFTNQYRSLYVDSIVIPAQEAINPLGVQDTIHVPDSTIIGARMYCEESTDGV